LQKFFSFVGGQNKQGLFVGPDIRKLIFDEDFVLTMTEVEKEAWIAFESFVTKFLENKKDTHYVTIVANTLQKFRVLRCLMSLKIHFLNSHLDFFSEDRGALSEEQGERFHQEIKQVERRYQGQWNVNMMGDCCWKLQREILETSHKKNCRQEKKKHKAIE
jgi:hypothetical protein